MICMKAYRANQYLGKPYNLQLCFIHCIKMERLKSLFSIPIKLWDCLDHGTNRPHQIYQGKNAKKNKNADHALHPTSICMPPQSKLGTAKLVGKVDIFVCYSNLSHFFLGSNSRKLTLVANVLA